MNRHPLIRVTTLIVMLGLAVTSLLLLFLLLGRSTVGATSEGAAPIPDIRAQNSTFTVSGTVKCGATGPVSDVEVYVWNQDQGSGFVGDTTDSSGYYSVTLDLPSAPDTYSLEFTPLPETGLNARAFTAIELMTDTVVNVDFCVCSGVWVSETVDSAGDVGGDTSLALEPVYPYTPHISYHDGTSDSALKYAWLSGTTWLSMTLDRRGGVATSLALVPTYYTPCISYGRWQSQQIWYGCLSGTTWLSKTVSSGGARSGTSLALEPIYPYRPHISYHSPWADSNNLYHAYLPSTVWMDGGFMHEEVEPPNSGTGPGSSLALEPASPYTPHISYYDEANEDLKYAWLSGTTWLSETVDSSGNVGLYTSLALDSNSDPHISYLDYTNYALKYAWLSGTTWLSETVDNIGEPPYNRGRSSLELDQSDLPYMSYYDAANGDLKFAHLNGTVWITQTVDSAGDVGQFNSLTLDQAGCPHISYLDATNKDLKYAYLPPIEIYLPIITKNR